VWSLVKLSEWQECCGWSSTQPRSDGKERFKFHAVGKVLRLLQTTSNRADGGGDFPKSFSIFYMTRPRGIRQHLANL
jgi:hypothetical protein